MTPLNHPRAGARVHLVAHRVNGTIAAYQSAGDRWRLHVQLDDGSTATVGAHEARYVGADGRQGELVMPPPPPPVQVSGEAAAVAALQKEIDLAEHVASGGATHGSVERQVKRLATLALDMRDLAEGLLLGAPLAQARANALFTSPVTTPANRQGVTTDG